MYWLLRADQKLKQNHEDVLLPAHLQELYLSVKDLGLILSQEIIRLSLTQCQNNSVLFFVMLIYVEKKMERLTSGDSKIVFGTNFRILDIGLMKCGRVDWQEAEATRKYFNIVLIHQDKKCFISELFKVIQDANPNDASLQDNVLIPNNFFEYICHIGCSINLHSITNSGLIPGGQILSKERQTVFFTAVNPMNKEHKDPYEIDLEAPRLAWYKQKSGEDIKTRCTGSTSSLPNRKDLSSIKQDRTQSSFTRHS